MRKKLFFTFTVIMSIFLLSCGAKDEEKVAEENVTIKVASWNAAAESLRQEIPGFQKLHPNVTVEVIEVDAGYTKVIAALASGTGAPDIIQTQARDFPAFLNKFPNQFADLTDKLNNDNLVDKFLPASIATVKADGKIYAMPWDMGPVALFYRTDMFEKAGVTPESIKTWDQFIEAGKKVQAANPGVNMTGYTDDNDFFHMLFNELGGTYVKDGKIAINSPEAEEAFSMMKRMADEGVLTNVKDWNGRIIAMNNSKLASIVYPVWFVGTMKTAVADQKGQWGIMELPAFRENENHQSSLGGSILAISEQSEHKDMAYEFLKYVLATDEGQKIQVDLGFFPSYTPYYENPNFKVSDDFFNGLDVNTFFAEQTTTIPNIDFGGIMLDAQTPLNNLTMGVMSGVDIKTSLEDVSNQLSKATKLEIYR